jgi:hypothetical protein
MVNPSKSLPARYALILAVSLLTLTPAARAGVSAPAVPAAKAALLADDPAAPGATLPASGANQEPGDDKTQGGAPASPGKTAVSSADNMPAIKPMVVHAERDAEIGKIVARLVEEDHYLQVSITPDMSQRWLKNYFDALDYNHLFFLHREVRQQPRHADP